MILFTDEEAQSYRNPKIAPEDVKKAAQLNDTQLVVFADLIYFPTFQETGATLRNLNGDIGRELDALFHDMTCR